MDEHGRWTDGRPEELLERLVEAQQQLRTAQEDAAELRLYDPEEADRLVRHAREEWRQAREDLYHTEDDPEDEYDDDCYEYSDEYESEEPEEEAQGGGLVAYWRESEALLLAQAKEQADKQAADLAAYWKEAEASMYLLPGEDREGGMTRLAW